MKYILTINGLDGPLGRVFGCDCDRCAEPVRRAHTSASLVGVAENGRTAAHILFDIGLGVTDSLFMNPHLQGENARLDWLCCSHWHPDHTAGINQLAVSRRLVGLRNGVERPSLPLWCRRGAARWLERHHDFAMTLCQLHESAENEPPGTTLPPLPIDLPGLTITPVTVSHANGDKDAWGADEQVWGCAVFVIETAVSKTVLLWDLDSGNEWIVSPHNETQAEAVATLSNADYLFADTAFWQAKPRLSSHPSFTNVQRYAAALNPRQTYLVHMSGHPDGRGNPGWGWLNGRWQTEARQVWQSKCLPGQVFVPEIGDSFALSEVGTGFGRLGIGD